MHTLALFYKQQQRKYVFRQKNCLGYMGNIGFSKASHERPCSTLDGHQYVPNPHRNTYSN